MCSLDASNHMGRHIQQLVDMNSINFVVLSLDEAKEIDVQNGSSEVYIHFRPIKLGRFTDTIGVIPQLHFR